MKTITRLGQRGFVLVSALIFLVILTLIVLSVANMTSSEEKIARNFRDTDIALAAAEAALRDAELRLTGMYQWDPTNPPAVIASGDFVATCTLGLCDSQGGPAGGASMDKIDFFNTNGAGGVQANSVKIGYLTNSPSMKGIVESAANCMTAPCFNNDQQPRYMIELVCDVTEPSSGSSSCATIYRITAQAVGRFPNTRVVVQELYRPTK